METCFLLRGCIVYSWQADIAVLLFSYVQNTVGVIKICSLVFLWITQHQSSKSLCPSLRGVPEDSKAPQLANNWMIFSQVIAIERKLLFSKFGLVFDLEKQCVCHFVFCHFIRKILCKLCKLGVFWNPQELLLMMGTEILKILGWVIHEKQVSKS